MVGSGGDLLCPQGTVVGHWSRSTMSGLDETMYCHIARKGGGGVSGMTLVSTPLRIWRALRNIIFILVPLIKDKLRN